VAAATDHARGGPVPRAAVRTGAPLRTRPLA